ncbi:phosphatidylinositol-specific phospholipase C domain-containing protein [Thalassomonas haliotis]|uniref:Phosphatidylinositol-specific phospholipase C domain-containing protein n=1 Tax=Thalassomonas haliotis TaxID=485448 RepID=A0ABY7VM01_9GAMM|nr:phosphatidylinositol-specific phospholipase C domain-containing protein [Thalassomonas haliotis]WDE14212.1 phosphatidylinositol-specific phospholipase C domain-containing protein [Thalassomonas haliotis]
MNKPSTGKALALRFSLAALFSYCASAPVLAGTPATWSSQALTHQYRLQQHEPIVAGVIAGTHNSYSSNAYHLKLAENQNLSITEQLNAGARILELDLWRTRAVEYGAVYLCHSKVTCGSVINGGDYIYLDTALKEISSWTRENPDQILIIKLENQMDDDDYHLFSESVQRQIGDIIYRPPEAASHRQCQNFPVALTPAQMLAQGKQVIFYGASACNSKSYNWVFKGTNPEKSADRVKDNRSALLGCSDHSAGRFALFYDQAEEDYGTDHYIPTDMIAGLSACGGSAFGFDWLTADDNRMKAALWSWAQDQPDNQPSDAGSGNATCAVSSNSRFYDEDCSLSFAYACSNKQAQWQITRGKGSWQNGEAVCRAEYGANFHFDVPRTAGQNKQAEAARHFEGQDYWLNYAYSANEKLWLSGEDKSTVKPDKSRLLKVKRWTDNQFVYSDYKTGTGNNISLWRSNNLPENWYRLGDIPGLATDGPWASSYSRSPGSSIVVFDDGSGKLAPPVSYAWRWNDWKTGGAYDITFWQPIPPAGYTCLGDIAIRSHSRAQPGKDHMRCVRNDLLLEGQAHWYWSDSGSGGEYDVTVYISSTKVGDDLPGGLPANVWKSQDSGHKVLNFNKVNLLTFEQGL